MSNHKMGDVPSMTGDNLTKKLSNVYIKIIENNLPLKTVPSVMLWGPPGVGKSQSVHQIAANITKATGKPQL